MQDENSAYDLLLASLHDIQPELAALRERVDELDDELHEASLGGTD